MRGSRSCDMNYMNYEAMAMSLYVYDYDFVWLKMAHLAC